MQQSAAVRPDPTTQRKAAIARGAALEHTGKVVIEPIPNFDLNRTIFKTLEGKGFVGHKAYGKTFEYFPIISRADYSKAYFGQYLNNYFGGSFKSMLHFFMQEQDLDLKTLGYKPLTGLATAINTTGKSVTLTLAEVGAAATAGKAKLIVGYIVEGRANEVQAN